MNPYIPHIDIYLPLQVRMCILEKAREALTLPESSVEDDRIANCVIDELRDCKEGHIRVSDCGLDYILETLSEEVVEYLDHLDEIM
jgi:hypothetical protein